MQLWPPLDGIHEQNWKSSWNIYKCQEKMSVAVLQDHVTRNVCQVNYTKYVTFTCISE